MSRILVKRDRLEALQRLIDMLEPELGDAVLDDWLTAMQIIGAMLKRKDYEEPSPPTATPDIRQDCGNCGRVRCNIMFSWPCRQWQPKPAMQNATTTAPHKWQEGMLVNIGKDEHVGAEGIQQMTDAVMAAHGTDYFSGRVFQQEHSRLPTQVEWENYWLTGRLVPCTGQAGE